jgi:diacylglycerol kinase family enzyme
MCLERVTIDTPKKTLRIALDGEVTRLTPPLHFRVLPGALRVIAPAANQMTNAQASLTNH